MKLIRWLLVSLLLVPPALGAENLKQNSDGSTVWQNGASETIGVGPSAVFVTISPTASPTTAYFTAPMRGIIREIMSVVTDGPAVTTAADTVTVLVASAASQLGTDGTSPAANFRQLTGYDTVNLTIAAGSSVGQVDSAGLASYATPFLLQNNRVDQYGVVAVNLSGGASNVYRVMIRIDPY